MNNNFPSVTQEYIDSLIGETQYYVFPNTTVTVCCITLSNGFTVVGKSACVCPQNFDKELGQKIAFNEAKNKIWELEGYLLNNKIKTL